jgi:peptidoglycan hydrolase CwlO-like protein
VELPFLKGLSVQDVAQRVFLQYSQKMMLHMKGHVMKKLFCWVTVCLCLCLCQQVAAKDVSTLSEADRKQVNEWMSQRAAAMIDAHKLQGEVLAASLDPKCTSPAVEALRERYRELQKELQKVQREIELKVQDVPAVQAKVRQIDELKKKEQELSKKIAEKMGE